MQIMKKTTNRTWFWGRGNFFPTERVVGVWNELPEGVVEAVTVIAFRKHLDR